MVKRHVQPGAIVPRTQAVMSADMSGREKRSAEDQEWIRQVGLRIQAFRQMRGWSQERFAAALGTKRGAVAMWETGKNMPPALDLARAEKQVGMPMEYVLFGETRLIDHGYMAGLLQECERLNAVLGGPVAQFPMASERPAAPPRSPRTTLHERLRGLLEPQAPSPTAPGRGKAKPRGTRPPKPVMRA
jgi:transcriptional regulator with XRE-family HTH domain